MRLNGFITDQCGAVVIKTRTVIVKINQDVACMQNVPRSRCCGDQHATHGSNPKVLGDDTLTELNGTKSKSLNPEYFC